MKIHLKHMNVVKCYYIYLLKIYFLVAILCGSQNILAQSSTIDVKLFELPDVIFKPIDVPESYRAAYELRIKQPIDHNNPEKGFFYQRAYLSHKGFDKPTVMVTEGYAKERNSVNELSKFLNANQIVVEHRFFGHSIPDELDYTYLNLEQVTADLHKINTLFKQLYTKNWISTGISKGGQTTIFYRYFYPDDVDVSVPYVAPFNIEFEDVRIYNFLDTIGSRECRESLREVQYKILENREKAIDYLRWYSYGAGLSFTYLSLEQAFEYAVLEYPFSFWQWGYNCTDVPDTTSSFDEVLVHLLNISNIDFFSDRDMERYGSHYYQAATEMGYYGYETQDFKGYLKALSSESNPHATFVPNKMKVQYDPSLSYNTFNWLQTNGDKFIYIYGGSDTWSATAIPENKDRDAVWIFLKGADHSEARIRNMTEEEKEVIRTKLENWLGIEINSKALQNWPQ